MPSQCLTQFLVQCCSCVLPSNGLRWSESQGKQDFLGYRNNTINIYRYICIIIYIHIYIYYNQYIGVLDIKSSSSQSSLSHQSPMVAFLQKVQQDGTPGATTIAGHGQQRLVKSPEIAVVAMLETTDQLDLLFQESRFSIVNGRLAIPVLEPRSPSHYPSTIIYPYESIRYHLASEAFRADVRTEAAIALPGAVHSTSSSPPNGLFVLSGKKWITLNN